MWETLLGAQAKPRCFPRPDAGKLCRIVDIDFREDPRLLKKSLSAQSAVQKRLENKAKTLQGRRFSAPELGAVKSAKAFFNTLTSSRQLGE
jgi:hypothetical protein